MSMSGYFECLGCFQNDLGVFFFSLFFFFSILRCCDIF